MTVGTLPPSLVEASADVVALPTLRIVEAMATALFEI
jgi:hypothetical protein